MATPTPPGPELTACLSPPRPRDPRAPGCSCWRRSSRGRCPSSSSCTCCARTASPPSSAPSPSTSSAARPWPSAPGPAQPFRRRRRALSWEGAAQVPEAGGATPPTAPPGPPLPGQAGGHDGTGAAQRTGRGPSQQGSCSGRRLRAHTPCREVPPLPASQHPLSPHRPAAWQGACGRQLSPGLARLQRRRGWREPCCPIGLWAGLAVK